jgi:hypothetical protein
MEILKDKKILVGGLAVIGGIALIAYLLKPKNKANSEGFFNAGGRILPIKEPILPKNQEVCNLPNNFVRQVVTKTGVIKNFCGRYDRVIAMTPTGKKGFQYRLRPEIPSATFINGNFVNSNGTGIFTTYQIISSSDYESAFIYGQNC